MATPSSVLAWRIPWIEEPGGPQPMGSQSQTWRETDTFTRTDQAKCVQMCTSTAQRPLSDQQHCPLHSLLAWGSYSLLQPVPVKRCPDLTVSPVASLPVPGIPGSQWPWQWLGLPVVQGWTVVIPRPLLSALSPLASSPASAPPGELSRMAGRKVQVHTSQATVWLLFLIQLGSYLLVLVCLPRAFFFFLPSFLSFLLPFLSSSLSSHTPSLSFSDLDYRPVKRKFYQMMPFYFLMTKVHLLLLKKTSFPESF